MSFEMRTPALTLSLAKLRWNAEAALETFIGLLMQTFIILTTPFVNMCKK